MKRKTRKLLIIAISAVALIAMLIAVYYCGVSLSASRSDYRLLSDLGQLNAGFTRVLREYFEREGHYPENLDVIIPTVWKICEKKNEPDLELLSHFKYSSDGTNYKLVRSYKRKQDGAVWIYMEYGRNGILEK